MTSDAGISPELAEARRRLAEPERAEAKRRDTEKVQSALYRIAELASAAQDLQEFYRALAVEAQGELLVKGKAQPVTVYAVGVDSLVPEGV